MSAADTYQRGTVVLSPRKTRALIRAEHRLMGPEARFGPHAVVSMAGVPLTLADETQHCKFIGITGSGKTTAISELIGAALKRGDRAIIADPDGAYSQRFYDPQRGDIIFNPFDARSPKWDIFSEITDDYDIEDLARSLIPDAPNSSDVEWREYGRTFFTDVTQRLWEATKIEPKYRTTEQLHWLLTRAPSTELRTLLRDTASEAFLDHNAAKMFASIRAITSSAVRSFKYIARQDGPPLSIREWVKEGAPGKGGVLFLPYHAGEVEALRSTISAWMRLGIFEAMNRQEGDQRLWFVVDELGALGRIGGLTDGLTRLRKFGGRVILGFQSIDQVQALYGKNDANAIVENCGNTLLLRCGTANDGGTSKFASQLIGGREMMRMATSKTHRGPLDIIGTKTRSEQFYSEHAVMAAQIEQLPNHAGYLRVSSRPEWMQVAVAKPSAVISQTSGASAMDNTAPRPGLFRRIKSAVASGFGTKPEEVMASSISQSTIAPEIEGSVNKIWFSPSREPVVTPTPPHNRAAPSPADAPNSQQPPAAQSQRVDLTSVPHEFIKNHYIRQGETGNYLHAGTTQVAFHDAGDKLWTRSDKPHISETLTEFVKVREWKTINVSGSKEFARNVWLQASLRGIGVNGFEATEADRVTLNELRARAQAPKPPQNANVVAHESSRPDLNLNASATVPPPATLVPTSVSPPKPAPAPAPTAVVTAAPAAAGPAKSAGASAAVTLKSTADAKGRDKDTLPEPVFGELLAYDAANFSFNPNASPSYYVKLKTPKGERVLWGIDFERAIKEAHTKPAIGDAVGVLFLSSESVTVQADGKSIATKRKRWQVEKQEYFHDKQAQPQNHTQTQAATRTQQFTADEKRAILTKAEELSKHGKHGDIGKYLDSVGATHSNLGYWRKQFAKDDPSPSPAASASTLSKTALESRNAAIDAAEAPSSADHGTVGSKRVSGPTSIGSPPAIPSPPSATTPTPAAAPASTPAAAADATAASPAAKLAQKVNSVGKESLILEAVPNEGASGPASPSIPILTPASAPTPTTPTVATAAPPATRLAKPLSPPAVAADNLPQPDFGELLEHGSARHQFSAREARSYYVKIRESHSKQEKIYWGADLQRALKESETKPVIHDRVGVRSLGRGTVTLQKGGKQKTMERKLWQVEKEGYFQAERPSFLDSMKEKISGLWRKQEDAGAQQLALEARSAGRAAFDAARQAPTIVSHGAAASRHKDQGMGL